MVSALQKRALLYSLLLVIAGCAGYQYEAKPLETKQVVNAFLSRSLDDPRLQDYLREYGYPANQWPLSGWDLGALTLAAWYFHPDLQVAIAEYGKARIHAGTVNQKINPGIQIPLEHHSDTADGKSPWSIGLLFDFILERPGKRQARQDQADAELMAARINVNAIAWKIYSALWREYLNYLAVLKNQDLLLGQQAITEQIVQLLKRRQELGQASEFEVNSMQLDLQRIKLELTNHKVTVVDASHALASSLGLPATALENIHIIFAGQNRVAAIHDLALPDLQAIALTQRLDIQQALADYAAHEAALRFEIEKQYPDLTLSPGFFFDQSDYIWSLGAAWILPLFQPQNEGPIRETLAQREVKQAEFLALQARVINEISAANDHLTAQQSALQEAEQLLQEVLERNRQMQRQYDLGYADHLQLTRSQLEVAAVEQAVSDLEFSVIRSAGRLEDTLQYPLSSQQAYQYLFNPETQK